WPPEDPVWKIKRPAAPGVAEWEDAKGAAAAERDGGRGASNRVPSGEPRARSAKGCHANVADASRGAARRIGYIPPDLPSARGCVARVGGREASAGRRISGVQGDELRGVQSEPSRRGGTQGGVADQGTAVPRAAEPAVRATRHRVAV